MEASGNNPTSDSALKFSFYNYAPSIVAAIIFVILFSLTTVAHLLQMVRMKTWYLVPFVIGGVFEVVGFAGRAASAKQNPNFTLIPYIIQAVLLLVAPALFAASIYMILKRIILLTEGEHHSLIRRRWLTKLFVSGDVLSFLMQSSGGGIIASAKTDISKVNLGQNIIVVGLFVQLVVFGLFIAVAGIFHLRMARRPTPKSQFPRIRWRVYLHVLYATSFLILIRSIFRVIEYLQGHDGYLLSTEVFLYVFDAALMFLTMVIMNWQHPSEIGILLRSEGQDSYKLVQTGGRPETFPMVV